MAERSAEKEKRSRGVREAQTRRERFLLTFWFLVSDPPEGKVLPWATEIPPFPYLKTPIFA